MIFSFAIDIGEWVSHCYFKVKIRYATRGDLDALADLFNQYRVFYRQHGDLAAALDFISERFENDDSIFLLAEEEGRAVGFARLYTVFSSVNLAAYFVINDLYVAEAFRRQKLGTALLDHCKELARQNDMAGLRLATQKTNDEAMALYRATGFAIESDFDFYFWPC